MSLAKRIIPCLDVKNGRTVKGINFVGLKDVGDPVELALRYEREGADELVFLDITATNDKRGTLVKLVDRIAAELSIPFTVGGGVRSVQDVEVLLKHGADKITINSAAVQRPELVREIADAFGKQCVVVAVDAKLVGKRWLLHTHGGSRATDIELIDWIRRIDELGAGEILFTSMNHDGTKNGFAEEALKEVREACSVPVIASGGAGNMEHFSSVFKNSDVDAALAASIFHYNEIPIPQLKKYLLEQNISIRSL